MTRVPLLCLWLVLGGAAALLPPIPPTVGKVWPRPQMDVTKETFLLIQPNAFKFTTDLNTCTLLTKAFQRYLDTMFPTRKAPKEPSPPPPTSGLWRGFANTAVVHLMTKCEDLPSMNMDEHYEIKVDSPDQPGKIMIIASSVWGALRGLESFSQLLVPAPGGVFHIYSTQLMDFPRFSHRGFMIDTSRHFLPVSSITTMLDVMAINKMNVLHWHLTDHQSFPYQSAAFPDLSGKGAWSERHVYSAADVALVVSHATERGIRVLPEFDTPGHTLSWGPGQPGLLTPCYSGGDPNGKYGPVDPSNAANYVFLTKLFTEVTQRFPDHYLHLGGDEVDFSCWKSNPHLTEFMQQQNISGDYPALEQHYITRLLALVNALPTKNGYLVWQEVFDNGVTLASDTLVHVWKDGGNMAAVKREMAKVTAAGFQTLLSSCWYLNSISYGVDWHKYYECDPQSFSGTAAQKALVVGGEACMWGEFVDRTNLISRSWPRGSVVAEKLWSSVKHTSSTTEAAPRLEEHRCRMLARGYPVEPIQPSFCEADLD